MKKKHEILIHIVDDDKEVLEFLKKVVSNMGYQTITSTKGSEVINNMKDNTADLFLMDIMLPDMSGFDLISKIRQISTYQKTPIIMTTALNDKENIKHAVEIGANAYITKPISIQRLSDKISSFIKFES